MMMQKAAPRRPQKKPGPKTGRLKKTVKTISKKPVGILVFPGTQCDQDVKQAFRLLGRPVKEIWHSDCFFYKEYSGFVLPGGFSYGDYLRAGALAAQSAVLQSLKPASAAGWPVLGICNGFQILCEAGFLEGALQLNLHTRFIDQWVELEGVSAQWGGRASAGGRRRVRLPIAHKEGRFYAPAPQLKKLEDENRIWWRYTNNPNGSLGDIAGIIGQNRSTAGLMPHPERAVGHWMGGIDGLAFFQNF